MSAILPDGKCTRVGEGGSAHGREKQQSGMLVLAQKWITLNCNIIVCKEREREKRWRKRLTLGYECNQHNCIHSLIRL
jgi:hypothetical protein